MNDALQNISDQLLANGGRLDALRETLQEATFRIESRLDGLRELILSALEK